MSLLLRTHLDLAKTSLKERKGRTFLTCLGIAIGVASIILIMSLTGSIAQIITSEIEAADSGLIVVRPKTKSSNSVEELITDLTSTSYSPVNLTLDDVTTIGNLAREAEKTPENPENIPEDSPKITISALAPLAASSAPVSTEQKTLDSALVVATTSTLNQVLSLPLSSGTFLSDSAPKAVVIGSNFSLELFATTETVGKTFTLYGEKFLIVGVLADLNRPVNFSGINFDNAILTNIDYIKTLDIPLQVQQIVISSTPEATAATANKINETLLAEKNNDNSFEVVYGNNIYTRNNSSLYLVAGMLTLVAGISLIVGGIGVMNIMLVSVAERTHEIGVRKAVGATNLNIFLQFLFESLIMCVLGGIAGLVIGYVLAFLISLITPFNPFISVEICLASLYISVVVGTLFGLYPAVKASLKPPIESLKATN